MLHPLVPLGTGPFTRERAYTLGFTDASLRTAVSRKNLSRLRRGVFVTPADRQLAAAHPETLHAQNIQALLLALHRSNVAAAATSAAQILGLEFLHKPPSSLVVCTDDPGVSGTHKNDYFLRVAPLPPEQVIRRHGVPLTSGPRTLLDLASLLPFADSVVLAESALRKGFATKEGLDAVLEASDRHPGIVSARRALEFASPWTGSPLESLSRVTMRRAGIPMPKPQQAIIVDGEGYLVDFLWDHLPIDVYGEADGTEKSVGPTRLETVRAIRAEKDRHQKLLSTGAEIVRWGWREAKDPALLAKVVRAGFNRALERSRGRLSS